jgi:multimeric flavodoxin WrbA
VSCFSCKTKENYASGNCALRDGLSPLLDEIKRASALVVGSPIYLSDVTGAVRSFMERLIFSNLAYDSENRSVFHGKIDCAMIYTMNVSEDLLDGLRYREMFSANSNPFALLGGTTEYMTVTDTCQFEDYAKYHAPMFDPVNKKVGRTTRFPQDLEAAFALGARMAGRPSA